MPADALKNGQRNWNTLKMAKTPKVRRKRDPFWRLRRAFGARRVESAKQYKRQASRGAERAARESPDGVDDR